MESGVEAADAEAVKIHACPSDFASHIRLAIRITDRAVTAMMFFEEFITTPDQQMIYRQ